ncbi:MAG: hypothetical protein ACK58U_02905 [Rubrivivax sp.]
MSALPTALTVWALARRCVRNGLWLATLALCGVGPAAAAQPGATVLYIATERLTDIVLGYRYLPHMARLGFGSPTQPWHPWFGGAEVQALVHLPSPPASPSWRPEAAQIIGNRFKGQRWPSALAALASFDADGNGLVEGPELRELYVWLDINGDGTVAPRDDALRPAARQYHGFDLRAGAKPRRGPALDAQIVPFSVMVPFGTRIHLLELPITGQHASPLQGYLAQLDGLPAALPSFVPEPAHPLSGRWRWKITDAERWKDATRPWGQDAGGQLFLAVSQGRIRGLVKTTGPHHDHIQLPLEGVWRDGRAHWRTVSPLGLTRSDVRLESVFGQPVLRGRSFTNRDGKVREWHWEARLETRHEDLPTVTTAATAR